MLALSFYCLLPTDLIKSTSKLSTLKCHFCQLNIHNFKTNVLVWFTKNRGQHISHLKFANAAVPLLTANWFNLNNKLMLIDCFCQMIYTTLKTSFSVCWFTKISLTHNYCLLMWDLPMLLFFCLLQTDLSNQPTNWACSDTVFANWSFNE